MAGIRDVAETISRLPRPEIAELPQPPYSGSPDGPRVALAVASMQRHMTDEGYQIMLGLRQGRYTLHGHAFPAKWSPAGETDVRRIIAEEHPSVVVVQDKREWEGLTAGSDFDQRERFKNVEALRERPDIFKLTILKDSHQKPPYHRQSAEEIGCHAWIVYYHPRLVKHLAPYVREQHLVRTYHSIDANLLSPYSAAGRNGCLLSGALSRVYPLRSSLVASVELLPGTTYLKHPGYHRSGSATPAFLRTLSQFKIAICTSSIYGYALRKIIEATAAGCTVVTDLPTDEILPLIDGNLYRVGPDKRPRMLGTELYKLYSNYNPERQEHFAKLARAFYDYRAVGKRLADDIERMRRCYGA